jgi:hypothetical protein
MLVEPLLREVAWTLERAVAHRPGPLGRAQSSPYSRSSARRARLGRRVNQAAHERDARTDAQALDPSMTPPRGTPGGSARRSHGQIGPPTRNRADSPLSRECACRCSPRTRIGVDSDYRTVLLQSGRGSGGIAAALRPIEGAVRAPIVRRQTPGSRPLRASLGASASSHRRSRRSSKIAKVVATVAPQLLTLARLRIPDRGQASLARSPPRIASPPTPSSPAPPGWPRSQPAQPTPTATASIAAATAKSTPRFTASPS